MVAWAKAVSRVNDVKSRAEVKGHDTGVITKPICEGPEYFRLWAIWFLPQIQSVLHYSGMYAFLKLMAPCRIAQQKTTGPRENRLKAQHSVTW